MSGEVFKFSVVHFGIVLPVSQSLDYSLLLSSIKMHGSGFARFCCAEQIYWQEFECGKPIGRGLNIK